MGPRSDNRGYGRVHAMAASEPLRRLQWVHGPITVVMRDRPRVPATAAAASMGPRSDNRGYVVRGAGPAVIGKSGFNGSTVR